MTTAPTPWLPLPMGSEFLAGDASTLPPNCTRSLINYAFRPNRLDVRPPFVYDNLTNVDGLMTWEDIQNNATHFIALDTSGNLYVKGSGVDTWGGAITGVNAGEKLLGWCNYRGKLYFTTGDTSSGAIPTSSYVFDGTRVTADPFGAKLSAFALVSFIDRIFLLGPREYITNAVNVVANAYDWTSNVSWPKTNVTATNLLVSGGKTVCRLFPTSLLPNDCHINFTVAGSGVVQLPDSTTDQQLLLRHDLTPVDASYSVPLTYDVVFQQAGGFSNPHTFVVGDMLTRNGFIQRCTTAGTENSAEPAWNAVKGATTAWDTATFTNIGSTTLASVPVDLLTATQSSGQAQTVFIPVTVPWGSGSGLGFGVNVFFRFGNVSRPSLTVLAPVDISLKDGLTDGDPAKKNRGFQITKGQYFYEFFNQESSLTAGLNLQSIIWTETTQPGVVKAQNSFELQEVAGMPTAGAANKERMVVWNRRALWTFIANSGADLVETPILPEGTALVGAGCLNVRAMTPFTFGSPDALKTGLAWIGERDAYLMAIGGTPVPICGEGMREAIMTHGSLWVETPTVGTVEHLPLIGFDSENGDIRLYTQRGSIFVGHMMNRDDPSAGVSWSTWSTADIAATNGLQVRAMLYNPDLGKMQTAWHGSGLTREEISATGPDTFSGSAGSTPPKAIITFRPIEAFAPRVDAILEEFRVFLNAVPTLGVDTYSAKLEYSLDRGGSWQAVSTLTPLLPYTRWCPWVPSAPTCMFRLTYAGPLGATKWSVSKAEALPQVMSEEYPQVNPG